MPVTMGLCERPHTVEVDLTREIAEQMEVPEGSKVEILGGRVYVSAAPVPKHVLVAQLMTEQLSDQLAAGQCATTAGAAVGPDTARGDYAIPDLIVTTRDALRAERPVLPAEDVDIVVEVVSKWSTKKDIELLPELYAEWRLPLYLLVDPRTGDILLHSEPVAGVYRQQVPYYFGDIFSLPAPLNGFQIDTSEFPRYDRTRG